MSDKDTEKPIKVDKWDGNAVKNALDDAIRDIFTKEHGFQEKNTYVDIRLTLSTLGCLVALTALLYDYLNPFPQSIYVLVVCVTSYFALMSILTLFMTFVEADVILLAHEKDKSGLDPDNVWTIGTTLARFDDNYQMRFSVVDGVTKQTRETSCNGSVAVWFTQEGVLLMDKFRSDIVAYKESIQPKKKDN